MKQKTSCNSILFIQCALDYTDVNYTLTHQNGWYIWSYLILLSVCPSKMCYNYPHAKWIVFLTLVYRLIIDWLCCKWFLVLFNIDFLFLRICHFSSYVLPKPSWFKIFGQLVVKLIAFERQNLTGERVRLLGASCLLFGMIDW